MKTMKTRRNRQKRANRRRRVANRLANTRRRRTSKRQRGGGLGSIPAGAVFAIQQDAFSAPVFANAESAENIYESRDSYKV
jgi:hypothetical protein